MTSLFYPPPTPASIRGRRLWGDDRSTSRLPVRSSEWILWYQRHGFKPADALHHACEARHHEIEVTIHGRSQHVLNDVMPGILPNSADRSDAGIIVPSWAMVQEAWRENLVVWDRVPDARAVASHRVSKQEWRSFLSRYRLAGVRFPAYEDPRSIHDRLVSMLDRTASTWDLPLQALGLNKRLILVIGGGTLLEHGGEGGQYWPSAHGGELHLPIDLPWSSFAHEWFHALDHWLGQMDTDGKGSVVSDASDMGDAFGRRARSRLNTPRWQAIVDRWHAIPQVLSTWNNAQASQAHWNASMETFPNRLATLSLSSAMDLDMVPWLAHHWQGMQQRWHHALQHGEWSFVGEADRLIASLDQRRLGDVAFSLHDDPSDWEALIEGIVLLQYRQNPDRFGAQTLRHATMLMHHDLSVLHFADSVDPSYYLNPAEQRAWSFEGACDPFGWRHDRPLVQPWGMSHNLFGYASGAQSRREGQTWLAFLAGLKDLLPGWNVPA